jgi:hypothetical protein
MTVNDDNQPPSEPPAYLAELLRLAEASAFPPGCVSGTVIAHDADCRIWQGWPCDCEPVVTPLPRHAE